MRKILICLLLIIFITSPVIAENTKKVALVMKALSNPFFIKMKEGARQYAKKHDIPFEVFGVERETDVKRQTSIVENLIARKYAAIVIAPVDSKELIPACKKAIDNGIVVINIDNPLHKATLKKLNITIPFVGSDNYKGASLVGDYLRKKISNKGRVIVIEGIRGVENADLRKKGFIDTITKENEIKIVAMESANWHTDEAFSLLTNLIQKHGEIDAIFCANDNMAIGALQSLDMFGMTGQVWIGSYDNIDEVRLEMRNKRIHATVEQHPELMGEYGVMLAVNGLQGKSIPQMTATPLDLITYDSFEKKVALSLADDTPFFKTLLEGATLAADLFGMRLISIIAKNDEAKQLNDIQSFITNKPDIIIINPTHSETILPAIEIAHSEGIPIITVDRKAASTENILSHIESNNIDGGRMAGEYIVQKLGRKGNILEFEGIPGTSAAHDRGKGFNDTLQKYSKMNIVGHEVAFFDREKARSAMTRLLKSKIHIDAIFAHNDEMIIGAIQAYQSLNKPLPRVTVGFDAIPEAISSIKKNLLTATIAQNSQKMGFLAIQNAAKHLQGYKVDPMILVDLLIIDK
ncbi:D-ribose transporter subunit RbsB [Candidatus Magnetomorum sp. HK-1]|nr:D-ribose transporter subunit RbsB [Candidatus Magnetomorum sp. HK-1]